MLQRLRIGDHDQPVTLHQLLHGVLNPLSDRAHRLELVRHQHPSRALLEQLTNVHLWTP